MNLSLDDAMELGQLLQFLDDWLAADRGPISKSLNCFVGCEASLRDDLAASRSCSARATARASSCQATQLSEPTAIPTLTAASTVSSS